MTIIRILIERKNQNQHVVTCSIVVVFAVRHGGRGLISASARYCIPPCLSKSSTPQSWSVFKLCINGPLFWLSMAKQCKLLILLQCLPMKCSVDYYSQLVLLPDDRRPHRNPTLKTIRLSHELLHRLAQYELFRRECNLH